MCEHHDSPTDSAAFNRRNFLKIAAAGVVGATFTGLSSVRAASAVVPKPQNVLTPDQALERLQKGNARYVSGNMTNHDFIPEREALVAGQNPFAGFLSCADSRIAPEYAFDTGRGDVFVVRIAGNFLDTAGLASFEFAVAVLGVPLLVVLGHEACGAVDSTIKAVKDGASFPGHIPTLVKAIEPAVVSAEKLPGNLLENSIRQNVVLNMQKLRTATPIIKKAVDSGQVKVVGGVYQLASGKVAWIS